MNSDLAERSAPRPPRGLRWLLVARTAVTLVLLGSATLVRLQLADPIVTDPLFALLAISFALIAFHAAAFPLTARQRWLTDVQLAADAFVVSAAVWLTGGINSPLAPLYVLPVVSASVLYCRRGGLIVTTLSLAIYGAMTLLQYVAPQHVTAASIPPYNEALLTLALNGAGLASVALLTGFLAERLRAADQRLIEASTRIADLQAFNDCVIDSLTGGLATSDLDGRILTFNRAAEQITGWPASLARGRDVREVLQVPGEFFLAVVRRDEATSGRRIELQYRARDARQVHLGLTAAPLWGGAGHVGHLFTFQDITERSKRERDAESHKRLAALGEMAAGIAHEIRNPLASIAGSVQVLRADLQLTAEQAQLMDIVLRESQRLNEIIRDFLAYARPVRPALQAVDLGRVVRDAATLIEHDTARDPRPTVTVRVPGEACWVVGDEAQLRQVVWNLSANALNAMPDGGPLELSVAGAGESRVTLQVRDKGHGIPAAELDRVFEPFRSASPGGTGLGLSIVHRIVTDAGGSIEVDSAEGRGTTVRVLLQRASAPAGQHDVALSA